MALLQDLKDAVIAESDLNTWEQVYEDMHYSLLVAALDGDLTDFIAELTENQDEYGFDAQNITNIAAVNTDLVVPVATNGSLQSQEVAVVPNTATYTFPISITTYIKGTVLIPNPGSSLTISGTIDPTNISTNEANLINGNLTDLVYNNSSSGTTNKELPGIDLASTVLIGSVNLTWWTNGSYMANNYSIQGSNNQASWTDLATGLSSVGRQGETINIPVTGSYRYLRPFCVDGVDPNWCTISEMAAFGPQSGFSEKLISQVPEFEVTLDGSDMIQVTNNSGTDASVTIYYL